MQLTNRWHWSPSLATQVASQIKHRNQPTKTAPSYSPWNLPVKMAQQGSRCCSLWCRGSTSSWRVASRVLSISVSPSSRRHSSLIFRRRLRAPWSRLRSQSDDSMMKTMDRSKMNVSRSRTSTRHALTIYLSVSGRSSHASIRLKARLSRHTNSRTLWGLLSF